MSITKSRCHCGAVELALELDNKLTNVRRCDCSLCSRKGYVMASVVVGKLTVVKGEDALSLYQFGTKVAEHYFCRHCGIHTHHKRRSNPNEYGVNIACIEGVNALDIADVPIGNGYLTVALK